jgi:translation initiation factor IF-1
LAKEEVMTFEGQINEILPDGRFGVTLENGHRLIVYTAGCGVSASGRSSATPCASK